MGQKTGNRTLLPEEPVQGIIRPVVRFLHVEAASGIVLLACAVVSLRLKIGQLPERVTWRHLTGGGFPAGIGFTMALFISELALQEEV